MNRIVRAYNLAGSVPIIIQNNYKQINKTRNTQTTTKATVLLAYPPQKARQVKPRFFRKLCSISKIVTMPITQAKCLE